MRSPLRISALSSGSNADGVDFCQRCLRWISSFFPSSSPFHPSLHFLARLFFFPLSYWLHTPISQSPTFAMTGKRNADVSPGSPSHKAMRGKWKCNIYSYSKCWCWPISTFQWQTTVMGALICFLHRLVLLKYRLRSPSSPVCPARRSWMNPISRKNHNGENVLIWEASLINWMKRVILQPFCGFRCFVSERNQGFLLRHIV